MYRVLFVCSGNTCRSPMAAGIFNKLLSEKRNRNVIAESAGTATMNGLGASPQAVVVARNHGVDIAGHRSRQITEDIAARATFILTMTGQQWYDVTALVPREKAAILPQFGPATESSAPPQRGGPEIEDPAGGSAEDYEEVFRRLETEIIRCFPAVIERVRDASVGKRKSGSLR